MCSKRGENVAVCVARLRNSEEEERHGGPQGVASIVAICMLNSMLARAFGHMQRRTLLLCMRWVPVWVQQGLGELLAQRRASRGPLLRWSKTPNWFRNVISSSWYVFAPVGNLGRARRLSKVWTGRLGASYSLLELFILILAVASI